jgi:hypothetical protein
MSITVTSKISMINEFKHKIKVINESGKTVQVTLREPRYQTIIYMKEELINYQYITVSYYDTLKIQIYYKNKNIFFSYLNKGEILTIKGVNKCDKYEPRECDKYEPRECDKYEPRRLLINDRKYKIIIAIIILFISILFNQIK